MVPDDNDHDSVDMRRKNSRLNRFASSPRWFTIIIATAVLSYLKSPATMSGTWISHLGEEGEGGFFIRDGSSYGYEFALFYFFFQTHSLRNAPVLTMINAATSRDGGGGGVGYHLLETGGDSYRGR